MAKLKLTDHQKGLLIPPNAPRKPLGYGHIYLGSSEPFVMQHVISSAWLPAIEELLKALGKEYHAAPFLKPSMTELSIKNESVFSAVCLLIQITAITRSVR